MSEGRLFTVKTRMAMGDEHNPSWERKNKTKTEQAQA